MVSTENMIWLEHLLELTCYWRYCYIGVVGVVMRIILVPPVELADEFYYRFSHTVDPNRDMTGRIIEGLTGGITTVSTPTIGDSVCFFIESTYSNN